MMHLIFIQNKTGNPGVQCGNCGWQWILLLEYKNHPYHACPLCGLKGYRHWNWYTGEINV